MTAFLMAAGVLMTVMVFAGLWLMDRAGVVTGARAHGEAPDPTEDAEAHASNASRSGILVDAPRE